MLLVLGSTRPSSPNQLGTSIKNLALNSPRVRTVFHMLYQIFYECLQISPYITSVTDGGGLIPKYKIFSAKAQTTDLESGQVLTL